MEVTTARSAVATATGRPCGSAATIERMTSSASTPGSLNSTRTPRAPRGWRRHDTRPVEHDGDLDPRAGGERAELGDQPVALVGQRQLGVAGLADVVAVDDEVQRRHGQQGVEPGDAVDLGAGLGRAARPPRGRRAGDRRRRARARGGARRRRRRACRPGATRRVSSAWRASRAACRAAATSVAARSARCRSASARPRSRSQVGVGRGQPLRGLGAQRGHLRLGRAARVERGAQGGALLGQAPAQLQELGLALLAGFAGLGAGLGQLAAQPLHLGGELVDLRQQRVPLGLDLADLGPLGRGGHRGRRLGVAG